MDYWTLVEKIRDALKDNADIEAWCQENYGSVHTVYIGYDEDDPPPVSDYPIICLLPVEQERSLNIDYGPIYLEIGYAVYNEEEEEKEKVITYEGIPSVKAFRETVDDILFGLSNDADLGGAWLEAAHELTEPIERFPLFPMNVRYTFRNPDRFEKVMWG